VEGGGVPGGVQEEAGGGWAKNQRGEGGRKAEWALNRGKGGREGGRREGGRSKKQRTCCGSV